MSSAIEKVSILGSDIIHIGYNLQDHLTKEVLEHLPSSTYVLISDSNIVKFDHVQLIEQKFKNAIKDYENKPRFLRYIISPGESSKTRETKAEIEDWMLSQGCTRDTVVLAIGGGIIGDMIGYVAATFMRGVKYVQIPTTLLSMVDSSIGGKTAVDTPHGKNLIGAFWQPKRIFIDLAFLETLPEREFINGMAEVIKTAAIWSEPEFSRLESYNQIFLDTISKRDSVTNRVDLSPIKDIIMRIVKGSVRVKAEVVSADEREGGLRNLLNFGHTIGHAYEAILTPQILHGECVSIGMVLEAELARYLGILSPVAVARLAKCLEAYHLPITIHDKVVRQRSNNRPCPVDDLLDIMSIDKKNDGSKKKIVFLDRIGKTYEKKASTVTDDTIRVILSESVTVGTFKNSPSAVSVTPPGSKSISNRALVLAALGQGEVRIRNLLHSDDTEHMLRAVQLLKAADIGTEDNGDTLVVNGHGGKLFAPSSEIYLGNAGTASRFLATVASLVGPSSASSNVVLTGNARMKQRPIGPLVDALRSNYSQIEYVENHGSLPLKVAAGQGLKGGRIELAATISSQYVSSILMCAPYAQEPVTLVLVGGKPISQFYIDMTIAMMKNFGIEVEKSKTEENTYHIPQGIYKNPEIYVVESDASSATYPLAFAAMTGTSCTIPNIGSASLQGDAKFAVDVLRPMGCKVTQTAHSTTVEGPPIGALRLLHHVDMEPMTDAFLTASVVAAIARDPSGKSHTTSITGIANQRVKECNRIEAMIHQLAKFGVTCRELADGLEIEGVEISSLKVPEAGVRTYDDHRVAMSFSLLGVMLDEPVRIMERRCVEKTWPGWWDTLYSTFKVDIGAAKEDELPKQNIQSIVKPNGDQSVVIIGMRGSGKSSMGRWIADSLGMKFVDLDLKLESDLKKTIPEIIADEGWEGFREHELKIFQDFVKNHPTGYVAACGGGIVETPAAREILKELVAAKRMVLHVHRNVDKIMHYLSLDKDRPAYVDDMKSVWLRRKQWYVDCSSHLYYSSYFEDDQDSNKVRSSLDSFLKTVTGSKQVVIPKDQRSYFLSLTYPDVRTVDNLDEVLEGVHAIELRVDLLKEQGQTGNIPSLEYVYEQIGFLRKKSVLPLIFTVRTKSQGGGFPDDSVQEAKELLRLAFRLGIEFVDVELSLPDDLIKGLVSEKGFSKIIMSHHNFAGDLKWNNAIWDTYYKKASEVGDIVKFVGMAQNMQDNILLENFRASHAEKPMIAINMGYKGQLSRLLNNVLTPVTHSALPSKAAPGQLSVKEINACLCTIGGLQKKQFFIAGSPVTHSPSPSLHNSLFERLGLPHNYDRLDTTDAKKVGQYIKSLGEEFGGASITIPLKVDIMDELDDLSPTAAAIGSVNTVINKNGKLIGDNTDWIGIYNGFQEAGAVPITNPNFSALIVGAGGTARAAIYALHNLGFRAIYVLNRTLAKAHVLATSFPSEFGVEAIDSSEMVKLPLLLTMSCIPADKPIDGELLTLLSSLLGTQLKTPSPYNRILLDAAYRPAITPIMSLAADQFGWKVVRGRDMLLYQGVEQFRLWTGFNAPMIAAIKALSD